MKNTVKTLQNVAELLARPEFATAEPPTIELDAAGVTDDEIKAFVWWETHEPSLEFWIGAGGIIQFGTPQRRGLNAFKLTDPIPAAVIKALKSVQV